MKLTNAEERVMKAIWKLNSGYMKDVLNELDGPKPASTTLATLLKRLTDKGAVNYNQHGSNREYYPLIKKTEYFSGRLNVMIKDFFNNSSSQFASFFANETDMSVDELKELKKIIEEKIDENKI